LVPASACTTAACTPDQRQNRTPKNCGTGSIVPQGPAVPIVSDCAGRRHPMHPFASTATVPDIRRRHPANNGLPAAKSLAEIGGIDSRVRNSRTRGGIVYDANKINQAFSPPKRVATGIRNAGRIRHRFRRTHLSSHKHGPRPSTDELRIGTKPRDEATLPA